jgi:hypothetical protein
MAKKEILLSAFNFSFGTLKQLADNTVALTDRDTVEFADRGFTPAKRTALVTAITNFDNAPTDEQLLGVKIEATAAKDAKRSSLEKQMRTLLLAAKNVFGDGGKYREFGDPNLSIQTDSDLARNAKTMATSATKYLTNLATEGITAIKITLLTTTRNEFDVAIDEQTKAINNRDNSTETRMILANDLYALVVKYNDIGKDIWIETSQAKYNDYIIYNTPSGTPEIPPTTEMPTDIA